MSAAHIRIGFLGAAEGIMADIKVIDEPGDVGYVGRLFDRTIDIAGVTLTAIGVFVPAGDAGQQPPERPPFLIAVETV